MDDVKSKRKSQFEKYRISGFSKKFKYIFVAYNFLAYVNNICSSVLLIRHMYLYKKINSLKIIVILISGPWEGSNQDFIGASA